MYSVGETIIYTTYGVCKVADTVKKEFNGEIQDYYLLVPIKDPKATVFVPANNPVAVRKLHNLLSREEIEALIEKIPEVESNWIDNENERKKVYAEIVRFGTRLELISVIKSIYYHQKSLKEKNKKLHMCDEQYFKEAQGLIYEEFSYVLNVPKDEIVTYITNIIEN